jgi:hypothetical protein
MGLKVTGNMLFSRGATFVSSELLPPAALGREPCLLLSSDNFCFLKHGFRESKGGLYGYSGSN